MAPLPSTMVPLGTPCPDFSLTDVTTGRTVTLGDFKAAPALLVMFICNHCPFVKAILDKIVRDAKELRELGIGVAAIMSNDAAEYPEDSFENMQKLAAAKGFTFPYLIDETQEVARAYDAVCTPDFFGFDAQLGLQYRGRLDESRMEQKPDARRELFEAMRQVALTGKAPAEQVPSIGCSIKWKRDAA